MQNNYFSEIGQKLVANMELPNSANIHSSTLFITQRCTSFYLQPIKKSDISKHIRQLNALKSTGLDRIPIEGSAHTRPDPDASCRRLDASLTRCQANSMPSQLITV